MTQISAQRIQPESASEQIRNTKALQALRFFLQPPISQPGRTCNGADQEHQTSAGTVPNLISDREGVESLCQCAVFTANQKDRYPVALLVAAPLSSGSPYSPLLQVATSQADSVNSIEGKLLETAHQLANLNRKVSETCGKLIHTGTTGRV